MTIGMNRDSANPACSPLVAASADSQLPSQLPGRVSIQGQARSTNVPLTTSDSHSIIASMILL